MSDPTPDIPTPDITALAERRAEARRGRDFAAADSLRAQLRSAGWEVVDRAGGFDLRPVEATPDLSVLVPVEEWPEDATRFVASVERHRPAGAVELVSVPAGHFAAARNAALAEATGEIVVLVDTSVELTGNLLGALAGALADPAVAVAGPFGLVSDDLCDYEERTTGDVVAVQGYCLAARRTDLLAIGGLREAFAFYRNADIDLSLRLRTHGDRTRRALAAAAGLCVRHPHRAWEETPPEERDRLSRRNMKRIHDRFLHRVDLTVAT